MMNHRTSRMTFNMKPRKHGAFTLIEVLVALAVMMVMMTIILVPINMGMNVFHIGKARAEVQQANQLVINQLTAELKQAVHVFPNEEMVGITNKMPYSDNLNTSLAPYFIDGTATRVSNTSRLDFLLPQLQDNGAILTPPVANNYVVTYYARRLDVSREYDAFNNPMVLWRAQYPYREDSGANILSNNADISSAPYTGTASAGGKRWLSQSTKQEPVDLSQLTNYADTVKAASHTQITPRDMVLVLADKNMPPTSYQPDSSFICNDVNDDGKIDRVSISLLLEKYDSISASGDKSQQIRSTQTIALPNIR